MEAAIPAIGKDAKAAGVPPTPAPAAAFDDATCVSGAISVIEITVTLEKTKTDVASVIEAAGSVQVGKEAGRVSDVVVVCGLAAVALTSGEGEKAERISSAVGGGAASTSPAGRVPIDRELLFLSSVVCHRVPTACISRSYGASGELSCRVNVGCADDLADVVESALEFGVNVSFVSLVVDPAIPPSAGRNLNAYACANALSEPSGRLARSLAIKEARRCVHGASIDSLLSREDALAAAGIGSSCSGGSDACGALPKIFVRVTSEALPRAVAAVARIRAALPHERLLIEAVEGGEEGLVYAPLGNSALSFRDVVSPPHLQHYPLTSKASILPASGSQVGPPKPDRATLVDDEAITDPVVVVRGHVSVGAFSNGGSEAVATAHGLPVEHGRGFLREASNEYGVRVEVVAQMNPAQFNGSGTMAFVESADAEPGFAGTRDDSGVALTSLSLPVIADASMFHIAHVARPTGLVPIAQLSRRRIILGSEGVPVDQALALPPSEEYMGGVVDIWAIHGKVDGVVAPRRALVLGYSTKELTSRGVGGGPGTVAFAQTVVYVAELLDGPPGPPLQRGDSGGSATQVHMPRGGSRGRAPRLHSLVGARAWSSSDGGATKRWFVLLVPIHFVVAQIARLLRDAPPNPVAWTSAQGLCVPGPLP